jgi:hypothetical protein
VETGGIDWYFIDGCPGNNPYPLHNKVIKSCLIPQKVTDSSSLGRFHELKLLTIMLINGKNNQTGFLGHALKFTKSYRAYKSL